MTFRSIPLLLLLVFALSSCKKSSSKGGGEESGQAKTASSSGKKSKKEEVTSGLPNHVVPVAMQTGTNSHQLTAGILFKPRNPMAEGETCVAFLTSPNYKSGSIYVLLEEEGDSAWRLVSKFRGNMPELLIAKVPSGGALPVADMSKSTALPDSLRGVLLAEWGETMSSPPPLSETPDPEKEARATEIRQRYQELMDEERQLRRAMSGRPPRGRNAAELNRQQREDLRLVQRELFSIRSESSRLGIAVVGSSVRLPPRSPRRLAEIVRADFQAAHVDVSSKIEGFEVYASSNAPQASGVGLPSFLVRPRGAELDVLSVGSMDELSLSEMEKPNAHFVRSSTNRWRLNVRMSLPRSPYGFSRVELHARQSNGDSGAEPLESFRQVSAGSEEVELSLDFDKDRVAPGAKHEVLFGRNLPSDPLIEPFEISFAQMEGGVFPQVKEPSSVAWKSPVSPSDTAIQEAKLSQKFSFDSVVSAQIAGRASYLVAEVQSPARLKLLDVQTEKWIGELALSSQGEHPLVWSADGDLLFVSDPVKGVLTSYSLPGLEKQREVRLSGAPLALAAGYMSGGQTLAVLYDDGIELKNVSTLLGDGIVIKDPRSRPPVEGERLDWDAPASLTRSMIWASPAGDRFSAVLSYLDDRERVKAMSFGIERISEAWMVQRGTSSSLALYGHHGTVYSGKVVKYSDGTSKRIDSGIRTNYMIPAAGPGVVAVSNPDSQVYFPPRQLVLHYLSSPSQKVPDLSSLAAAEASMVLSRSRPSSVDLAQRIFVFPALGKVISVGRAALTIEAFSMEEGKELPTLVGAVAPARRGFEWSYLGPVTKLVKGPEGASIDDEGALVWNVPANFPVDFVSFEIGLGQSSQVHSFLVQVIGQRDANQHLADGGESKAVPAKASLIFPNGIDQLLPCYSRNFVGVVSGGSRVLTLIDLDSFEELARYESSTGVAAFALGQDFAYVWHLNGGILETRRLPNLDPAEIAPISETQTLLGIVSGSSVGGLEPLALFSSASNQVVCRGIDQKTLSLGPPITLPSSIRPRRSSDWFSFASLPSSGDGKRFSYGDYLIERKSSDEIVSSPLKRKARASRNDQLSIGGDMFFNGGQVTELDSSRSWALGLGDVNLATGEKNILWPDQGERYVLAVSKFVSAKRLSLYRIHFVDLRTKEVVFELDQLFEWDESSMRLFTDSLPASRIFFSSDSGTLLTISADGKKLVGRQLSIEEKK